MGVAGKDSLTHAEFQTLLLKLGCAPKSPSKHSPVVDELWTHLGGTSNPDSTVPTTTATRSLEAILRVPPSAGPQSPSSDVATGPLESEKSEAGLHRRFYSIYLSSRLGQHKGRTNSSNVELDNPELTFKPTLIDRTLQRASATCDKNSGITRHEQLYRQQGSLNGY